MPLADRYRPVLIALPVVAAVVAAHVADTGVRSLVERDLLESLHAPGFAVISAAAFVYLRQSMPGLAAGCGTVVFAVLLALVSEALQLFVQRSPEWSDIAADMIGTAAGLTTAVAVTAARSARTGALTKAGLIAAGIALSVVALRPAVDKLRLLAARAAYFPVLADFDRDWQRAFVRAYNGSVLTITAPGAKSPHRRGMALLVQPSPERYSGVAIDPRPDWSGYDAISFVAATADGLRHEVVFRVHDTAHNQQYDDRYNRVIEFGPTPTLHRIGLADIRNTGSGRQLDMRRIEGIAFFVSRPAGTERLLLDEIRLEKSAAATTP